MLRLLSLEIHKLKHNRASRNLILIYFGLLLSIAFIAVLKIDLGFTKINFAEQGIFDFPYIWHFNTYIAAIPKIFLLLVIVSMMSNEYSFKTLKQNLIDGLSKKEFILSKFYTVVLFSIASTLFVFITSLILGLIYSKTTSFSAITTDLSFLLGFFIKLLTFFSMGLFFGILIKRSAFAVAGIIIWFIGEGIISGILKWKSETFAPQITQFFPLKSIGELIKQPFSRLKTVKSIGKMVGTDLQQDYSIHFTDIAICLAWTAIFISLSYFLLKKRDL